LVKLQIYKFCLNGDIKTIVKEVRRFFGMRITIYQPRFLINEKIQYSERNVFRQLYCFIQLYDVFFRKYPKYLKYLISPKHPTSPDIATEGMSNKARR